MHAILYFVMASAIFGWWMGNLWAALFMICLLFGLISIVGEVMEHLYGTSKPVK